MPRRCGAAASAWVAISAPERVSSGLAATVSAQAAERAPWSPTDQPVLVRLRPTRSRRRPVVLATSLVLVVAGTAVVSAAFERAGATRVVLSLTHAVPARATLTTSDLRAVRVHVPAVVAVVPAAAERSVVGRLVVGPLAAGTLLAPGDVASGEWPLPGSALVGVALGAGQLPAGGVSPGQQVDVVATTAAAGQGQPVAGAAPGTVVVANATVASVTTTAAAGGATVAVASLVVPVVVAPTVAELSAAGAAALVVVADG